MNTEQKAVMGSRTVASVEYICEKTGKPTSGEIIGCERQGTNRLLCLNSRGWTQYVAARQIIGDWPTI